MPTKCKKGQYKGETVLISPCSYPVTKHKKLSCKRVKAALTYGSRFGDINTLKRNGICKFVRKCKMHSEICHTKGKKSKLEWF